MPWTPQADWGHPMELSPNLLPPMETPRLPAVLPVGPGTGDVSPSRWKSGPHPPGHPLSVPSLPLSHPGTVDCFPGVPLLPSPGPWHPQGREDRAGVWRLAFLCQIPALPFAHWVISGL